MIYPFKIKNGLVGSDLMLFNQIHIFIKYLGPSWIIGVEKLANKTKKDPIFKPFLAYLQHRNNA